MAVVPKVIVLALLATVHARIVVPRQALVSRPTDVSPSEVDEPAATVTPLRIPQAQLELLRRAPQPTLATLDGYSYVGCYEDGGDHILTITSKFDSGMTPDLCKNLCSLASSPMFALENSYSCLCGVKLEPFAVSAKAEECTESCAGRDEALCGANKRANVYSATVGFDNLGGGGASSASGSAATTANPPGNPGPGATTTGGTGSRQTSGSGSGGANDGGSGGGGSGDAAARLSVGAIVGIAIGSAGFVAIIAAVLACVFCCRRKRDPPVINTYQPPTSMHQPQQYGNLAPAPSVHEPAMAGVYNKPDYTQSPAYSSVSPVGTEATPPVRTVSPAAPPPMVADSRPLHEMHAPLTYEMPGSGPPR